MRKVIFLRYLPKPKTTGTMLFEEIIFKRRSIRSFSSIKLSDEELSQILFAAQGITDPIRGFRAAPSAGATYPLETSPETEEGVFRYSPSNHALETIREGDFRDNLAEAAWG